MLNDASGFKQVYIVCGYTDLRSGIDSLASLLESRMGVRPYIPDTLYLFCGRKTDRIKGLVWEKDGFLLLYKRLEDGSLTWPRTEQEAAELTEEQFQYLMLGLNPLDSKVKEVHPKKVL